MQRYLINKNQINNNLITIIGNDVHHIKNVMRMNVGDNVYAFDNEKNVYLCKIIDISEEVTLQILENVKYDSELDTQVTIAQGLVNRDKTEEVIRRLVELGCYKYQPVIMDKSVIKYDEKNIKEKAKLDRIDRLNRIVKEASEQSERISLMKVESPISLKELINSFDNYDLVLFCHVASKDDFTLRELIHNKKYNNILVVIGPESGFSEKEVKLLDENKALRVSLGKRVLRTETAPLSIMSIIAYEVEQ